MKLSRLMKPSRLLLVVWMLIAGTLGSRANIPFHVGYNFVTWQITPAVDINSAAFVAGIPANWSDPNGLLNATVYIWDYPLQGFFTYQYFTAADADANFGSDFGDGWYDASGVKVSHMWNPGQGIIIHLPNPAQATTLTAAGPDPGPTTYPMPSTGFDLRGSPTPNPINGSYVVPADIVVGPPVTGDAIYVYKDPPGTGFPGGAPSLQNFDLYYYDSNQGGWVPRTGTVAPYPPHITPTYRAVWLLKVIPSSIIEGDVIRKNPNCSSPGKLPNWVVQAQNTGSGVIYYGITGTGSTSPLGHYSILVPPGANYSVSAHVLAGWTPLTSGCGVSPAPYTISGATAGTFYTGNDFFERSVAVAKDLAVDLASFFQYPLRSPCAGQNMTYVISYRNDGNASISPIKIVLNYPPTQTFVADDLTLAPGFTLTASSPGTRTWVRNAAFSALSSGNVKCTVTLPATPTTGPISANATIFSSGCFSDQRPSDNTSTLNQQIVCSYDPNDLLVSPAGCGSQGFIPAGQPLTYLIRFQNTGNGLAYQVVVSNTLNANLDVSTLQVLGSSHPNVLQVQGNQLVFTFPNIYLPSEANDELGSQGYVKYQISPLGGAPAGTVITNRAEIYFDLNAPIFTATTTNTITDNPVPVASFSFTPAVGSAGHTNDFTYTGGSMGAIFLWDFGPDATPSTSTDQNPTNIVFASEGDHLVTLQVTLGGCQTEPAVQIVYVGVPSLAADLVDDQLVLSWEGAGFHLQEKTDLLPTTAWTASATTVLQIGSFYTTALTMDSEAKFYRLSQVPP